MRPRPFNVDRMRKRSRRILSARTRVEKVVDVLDALGVPVGYGRPRAERILRASGVHARHEVVSAAIRERRKTVQDRSPSGDCPETLGQVQDRTAKNAV